MRLATISATVLAVGEAEDYHDVAFAAANTRLVAAGKPTSLEVWPLDKGLAGQPTSVPAADKLPADWKPAPPRKLAAHPTLPHVAVLDDGGRVTLWNVREGALLGEIAASQSAEMPAEPGAEKTPQDTDTPDATPEAPYRARQGLGNIAYSKDGSRIVVAHDRQLRSYDAESFSPPM